MCRRRSNIHTVLPICNLSRLIFNGRKFFDRNSRVLSREKEERAEWNVYYINVFYINAGYRFVNSAEEEKKKETSKSTRFRGLLSRVSPQSCIGATGGAVLRKRGVVFRQSVER